MSVTLQIKVNGGAPQTGKVIAVSGDVITLTAASKVGWVGSPPARWELYDVGPGYALPAGWTLDATTGTYYYDGNEDPPPFTLDANWGKFVTNLAATEGTTRTTDTATGISVVGPNGVKSIGRGEGSRFGGLHKRWVKDLQDDLKALSALMATDPFVVGGPAPKGTIVLDPANDFDAQKISSFASTGAATLFDLVGSVVRVVGNTSTFIRGALSGTPQGGLLVTPGADAAACVVNSRNADSTTAKPLTISGTACAFDASTTCQVTSGSTLALRATTKTILTGAAGVRGGLSFTPAADNGTHTLDAFNVDEVTRTHLNLRLGSSSMWSSAGGLRVCGTATGAVADSIQITPTVIAPPASSTSFTIAQDQDASAAGGTMTVRAQRGFAGFVGGVQILGGGAGGTEGTNLGGETRVYAGALVGGSSADFGVWSGAIGAEVKFLNIRRVSGVVYLDAGPYAASTDVLGLRGTFVNVESNTGHVAITPVTDAYIGHGAAAGDRIYHRESGTVVFDEKNDADSISWLNWISGVTAVEFRHNASPRVAFDSTSVTLSGDVVYRESAAGVEFERVRTSTATISTATTTYVETVSMLTLGNGTYDVEMDAVLYNTTDTEGARYHREATFRKGAAAAQIGTTDAGGTTDKEDAGQTGNDATIDRSGNDIRFGVVTDSTNEHKWDVTTTIRRRAA